MKKIKVKIPMYDYDVTWLEIETVQDKEKVFQEMKKLKCNISILMVLTVFL